jgi:class 3 adenylate cyclase/tetratricopeptide (TPR) repeat protein
VREQRKVVTVLFCDLVGSTALGESTDPEALRARMRRYFGDLRAILERHGGSVEKFAGDAVMAVFGIPTAHEDDALRAVRAASEMQQAIAGHGLEARIGVNTGEVVVGGEGETLVTGDAVNVAARFEQAAAAGEILIGAETRLLVRDAVQLEAVEPLTLKGKSRPVEAFRLLGLIDDAAPVARHLDTPLVGRERERQRLWRAYEDAVADGSCQLFTLLGPAGIGKSRLVADFLERVGDSADVLRGRCLSYGEGITYWPLAETLIAIGVAPDSVIGSSPPETQLAFRRLLEARAAERPQVVVIDDLQWAEPVFIDLVEHVADLSRDAPIFLLCIARTELLDVRPGWGGGKLNATSLLLEPLDAAQCGQLMELLAADAGLDDALRERITAASAGNPLYVEEMLAMVREHGGDGDIAVPPTIHALLQARIDSLDGDVRVVMERGSVEGEVFHRGTVAELAPASVRDGVQTHLATLVRKELIRSTATQFAEDEGFRFRHLLIRDAAYESLPKATRAELHEHFAKWLATHDLVERDEIVGYHLEQAYRYRGELDLDDPRLDDLATRAAEHLDAAGRGALARGDYNAGRSLLRRAHALYPQPDRRRLALVPDLALALWESGELQEARELAQEARAGEDAVAAAVGGLVDDIMDIVTDATLTYEERAENRERARIVLESSGDEYALSLYWWAVAGDHWNACRTVEAAAACARSLEHLDASGAVGRRDDLVAWMGAANVLGPIPVEEGIQRVAELRRMTGGAGVLHAGLDNAYGRLLAMRGETDEGRRAHERARQTLWEAGLFTASAGTAMARSWIEERAGDLNAGESALREGIADLERLNDRAYRSTTMLLLAENLYAQGRLDEIRGVCAEARELTPDDDITNVITLEFLEAMLLREDGRLDEAEQRGRLAVELADRTDHFISRGHARLHLATTLARAGRHGEASEFAAEGFGIIEAKGDITGLAANRRTFAELASAAEG